METLFFFFNTCEISYADTLDTGKEDSPIAVMIGNSPREREIQKGLLYADIVYEIEVEFPFTRFMAIFLNDVDTKIGPVRSSRYYFSRICAEWNAIFAHCGGQFLKNSNILDMNELYIPNPYWRDKEIGGWINLFTSTQQLRQEAKKHNHPVINVMEHPLLNWDEPCGKKDNQINKITIKYHADYIVSYEYCPSERQYYRYNNQNPFIDQVSLEQITVSNIIIQLLPIEEIKEDEEGRIQMELVGEGIGRVFQGGDSQPIKWIKKSKDEPTLFLDQKGSPLIYQLGATWIHLLSPESEIWTK